MKKQVLPIFLFHNFSIVFSTAIPSALLVKKQGCRRTMIFASVLTASSLLASVFIRQFAVLCVTLGIFAGKFPFTLILKPLASFTRNGAAAVDGAGAVKIGCIEVYETIYMLMAPTPSTAPFTYGFSTHCPTVPLDAVGRRGRRRCCVV